MSGEVGTLSRELAVADALVSLAKVRREIERQRPPSATVGLRSAIKYACAESATTPATPVAIEVPGSDRVPVAADQQRAAALTICALRRLVVDVAGIDVVQAD